MKIPILLTVVFTSIASLGYAQMGTMDKTKTTATAGEPLSASDKELVAFAGKESSTLTDAQKASLLELANTGDLKAIEKINGIGPAKAKNVIAKRPYKSVDDLIMVDGIGKSTFKDVIVYAKGEQKEEPKPAMKPKAAAMTTPATAEAPAATPKPKKVKAPKVTPTPAPAAAATSAPAATATPKPKKVKAPKVAKTPEATASPAASPAASPEATKKVKVKAPKKVKEVKEVAATPTPTP